MKYIIAYKLKRKNARRKECARFNCEDQHEALMQFNSYCAMRERADLRPKQWELLTGDWKHISFYEEENNESQS